jgi:hypothetical protein
MTGLSVRHRGIWADIVATPETNPAQIDEWHDSRPVRESPHGVKG